MWLLRQKTPNQLICLALWEEALFHTTRIYRWDAAGGKSKTWVKSAGLAQYRQLLLMCCSIMTIITMPVWCGVMQCWPGAGQVCHEALLRGQSTSCWSAVTKKVSSYLTSWFLLYVFLLLTEKGRTQLAQKKFAKPCPTYWVYKGGNNGSLNLDGGGRKQTSDF